MAFSFVKFSDANILITVRVSSRVGVGLTEAAREGGSSHLAGEEGFLTLGVMGHGWRHSRFGVFSML